MSYLFRGYILKAAMLAVFLCLSAYCYPQSVVQGHVRDVKTREPLAFCAVSVKGSPRGGIANEEGAFRIPASEEDTLVFSFIGYKSRVIPVRELGLNPEVFLESTSIVMKELIVRADDSYLYDILLRCRRKMLEAGSHVSKAYFSLETTIRDQPVELLEAYYNGYTRGASVEKLLLKNGRIGLAKTDNRFFVSFNTSRAISYLSLAEESEYLPYLPFQLGRSRLRKMYILEPGEEHGEENLYHIRFRPADKKWPCFEGEAWIDKETYAIRKITMESDPASVHPFLPLYPGDSLSHVSMKAEQVYDRNGDESLLNHIRFSYSFRIFDYVHRNWSMKVSTTGLLHFYDYEKPFPLPYFQYDTNESDYRKISFLPYNESFWDKAPGMVFTERQQKSLEFFQKNGFLINFNQWKPSKVLQKDQVVVSRKFFEDNYILWSDTARISLKQKPLDSLLLKRNARGRVISGPAVPSDLYRLKAQIFLDANPSGDTVQHYCATVFDVYQTFYNLTQEPYTDCFINIYFDLCEIERRKMDEELRSHRYTMAQVDSVYRLTVKAMEDQTALYLRQVQTGRKSADLYRWNAYVRERLGIDNAAIFRLQPENK
jgi:hypothetical protein